MSGSADLPGEESPHVSDRPESWPVHEVEQVWNGPAPFSVRRDTISAPGHPEPVCFSPEQADNTPAATRR